MTMNALHSIIARPARVLRRVRGAASGWAAAVAGAATARHAVFDAHRHAAGRAMWLVALALVPATAAVAQAAAQGAAQEATPGAGAPSAAEQALFMEPHLVALRPPLRLAYRFERVDTRDRTAAFSDRVELHLRARADGRCCSTHVDFLRGERALPLPDIDDASANPVTMYFLEREVREMQRLTGGQAAHFRRRIRVALADEAQVSNVTVPWGGRELPALQVTIAPYERDPQRARFARYAGKQYQFVVSRQVPGGIYSIRSRLPAPDAGQATVSEDLLTLQPTQGAKP